MMRRSWFGTEAARLPAAAATIVALALAGVGAAADTQPLEKELVIVATGGVFEQLLREHFYEPFTRATGVKVRPVAASATEQWTKVRTMTQVGKVEWDVVSLDPNEMISRREFLAQLDCGKVANAASQGVAGTCQGYGLLRTIGGGVLAYNTQRFPPGQHP